MDRDRWERVNQLYHAALERAPEVRTTFLNEACADDSALRHEVETLLGFDGQAASFMEADAFEAVARELDGEQSSEAKTPALVGQQLGAYKILAPLGRGGMGEVFLALDTRLKRKVALKLLPTKFTHEHERVRRFEQEARAASALNHPNIITIHEIGVSEGAHYLVTEYVEGETLRTRLRRGRLNISEVMELATQITSALAAAHEAGIIHRDIKPENVMVRKDGLVKVLDFGLAKLLNLAPAEVDSQASTAAKLSTASGVVLGTASYMSPEQARGQKVDHRTDIFSLGVMLYEMLAGHRPFEGATVSDVLAALLEKEPLPLAHSLPEVPAELERIVRKALRKDKEERYQTVKDLLLDLKDLKHQLESQAKQVQPAPPALLGQSATARASATQSDVPATVSERRHIHRAWYVVAAVTLILLTAGLMSWVARREKHGTAADAPIMRVTSDAGLTTDPALSPDGKLVVYASDRAGGDNLDLWVQQIGGGAPLRLTSDPANEYEPSFSPDGTRIVFRSERDGGGLYAMPALGGEPRLIAKGGQQPRFSPDGTRIAYVKSLGSGQSGITEGELFVVPSTGGTARKLVSQEVGAASPVWSPDGAFILFARGKYRIEDWGIVRSDRAEGGADKKDLVAVLPLDEFKKAGLADLAPREWLTGNRILIDAKFGDSSHIFEVGLAPPSWVTSKWGLDASPRQLTFGTGQDERPTLASSVSASGGRRLAFASLSRKENLWSVALDTSRPWSGGKLTQLTHGSGFHLFPSISRDGKKAAFISSAAYNDEVLLLDLETGKTLVLSTTVSRKRKAHIRPDGSAVFYGDAGTTARPTPGAVYTVSVTGGPPERLCENCNAWVWDWSPDRRLLLKWGPPNPWVAVTLVNVEARESRVFLQRPNADLYNFNWSPDGRWLVFEARAAGHSRIYVAPFSEDQVPAEDTWILITDGATYEDKNHWSPDGGWIYTLSDRDGFFCVWAYPVDPQTKKPAGPPVAVFHAHGARLSLRNANLVSSELSVAQDKVIFNQGEITGNIWMTELRAPQ
jgi:eukaryotic-like serine/threonine-protein kinase